MDEDTAVTKVEAILAHLEQKDGDNELWLNQYLEMLIDRLRDAKSGHVRGKGERQRAKEKASRTNVSTEVDETSWRLRKIWYCNASTVYSIRAAFAMPLNLYNAKVRAQIDASIAFVQASTALDHSISPTNRFNVFVRRRHQGPWSRRGLFVAST